MIMALGIVRRIVENLERAVEIARCGDNGNVTTTASLSDEDHAQPHRKRHRKQGHARSPLREHAKPAQINCAEYEYQQTQSDPETLIALNVCCGGFWMLSPPRSLAVFRL